MSQEERLRKITGTVTYAKGGHVKVKVRGATLEFDGTYPLPVPEVGESVDILYADMPILDGLQDVEP